MGTEYDYAGLVAHISGQDDNIINADAGGLLHSLVRLHKDEDSNYFRLRRRLLRLTTTAKADELRPQAPHGHVKIDKYREKIWSPNVDLATVTTNCGVVLKTVNNNVNLAMFGPSNAPPTSATTRVATPTMLTGMLTLDVIPKLDTTILNDFEVTLCGLKLVTTLTTDVTAWTSMDPRLRLFVKEGRTHFDVSEGATITTKNLDDFGLRDEFIITTLGQLLRWSIVEALFNTCGSWDVHTTSHVLGVPSLPFDNSLSITKVGRLSMSLHYSYLRMVALYKGVFLATMYDYYNVSGTTHMFHKLYTNFGKAMNDVFAKYEGNIQLFDVSLLDDEVKLEALRLAEQRHYFYVGEWSVDDEDDNVEVEPEEVDDVEAVSDTE